MIGYMVEGSSVSLLILLAASLISRAVRYSLLIEERSSFIRVWFSSSSLSFTSSVGASRLASGESRCPFCTAWATSYHRCQSHQLSTNVANAVASCSLGAVDGTFPGAMGRPSTAVIAAACTRSGRPASAMPCLSIAVGADCGWSWLGAVIAICRHAPWIASRAACYGASFDRRESCGPGRS